MSAPLPQSEIVSRLESLEKRLNSLDGDFSEFMTFFRKHQNLVVDFSKKTNGEIQDAFDRITNVEAEIFPHLRADLSELYEIIGDRPTNSFDLDRKASDVKNQKKQ